MATVAELLSLGNQVIDGLNNIALKIQELKDQLAAGGTITEADLDPVRDLNQQAIDTITGLLA